MNTKNNYYVFNVSERLDERGTLCVAEFEKELPFCIKRVFFEYGFKGKEERGLHANRKSSFVMICVHGSCDIEIDDGNIKENIRLNKPNKALYINKMIWKKMYNFSDDCVLLVLSDEKYDSNEYIRSYSDYLKEMRNK